MVVTDYRFAEPTRDNPKMDVPNDDFAGFAIGNEGANDEPAIGSLIAPVEQHQGIAFRFDVDAGQGIFRRENDTVALR